MLCVVEIIAMIGGGFSWLLVEEDEWNGTGHGDAIEGRRKRGKRVNT